MGMGTFRDRKVASHGTMKLIFGINRPFKIRLDERWYGVRTALVDEHVDHYINGEGDWQIVLWISGDTSLGTALKIRSLKGRKWALHNAKVPRSLNDVIQTAGDEPDPQGALVLAETLIRVYGGIKGVPANWDDHVKRAVEEVDANPGVWSGQSLSAFFSRPFAELNADFKRVAGIGLDDYIHNRKWAAYLGFRQSGIDRRAALEAAGLPGWEGLKESFESRFGLDLNVLEETLPFVGVYEGWESGPILYL